MSGPNGTAAASQREWLRTRRVLNANRAELTHAVSHLYAPEMRLGETGTLLPEGWRLARPVDLASVRLVWQDDTAVPTFNGQQGQTRPVRPLASAGRRYPTYHRAMRDLDRPRLFENRPCYRLLDAHTDSLSLSLTCGNMCYFDMIDVGECLAHEAANAAIVPGDTIDTDRISWPVLPFRRLLDRPFDLADYPLMLSVSTLTIRRSRARTSFRLLRRNPAKVAIGGGMLSVFPTGVFQPASILPAPDSPDFDLWRNVMREYGEEYLGNPEHDGAGPPIDYENTEPFRSLDAARRAGKLNVYCLGAGIDALNYVGDVFTVAVFDADTFDRIFGDMVEQNDEGEVETEQFTFDEATVTRLLTARALAPSGAACLHLAWEHHAAILPAA